MFRLKFKQRTFKMTQKISLKWDIRYSSISSVVISDGEVLITTRGGSSYKFPEWGNARKINKLRENLPAHKVFDVTDDCFNEITSTVCDVYKQDVMKVYSRSRKRDVVQTRQICMTLSRIKTKKSLMVIGKHYGGFDHATVLHAMKTVRNLLDTNKQFRREVGHLFLGLQLPHYKS